jgi:hypothetical protein
MKMKFDTFFFCTMFSKLSLCNVSRMGERRCAGRVLVGKLDGRIPLGRPRCNWEDNIKMDFREV